MKKKKSKMQASGARQSKEERENGLDAEGLDGINERRKNGTGIGATLRRTMMEGNKINQRREVESAWN